MVKMLSLEGFTPISLDNLSSGRREAVLHGELIVGDIADHALLNKIFSDHNIQAVMHFASLIQVSESVIHPARYYRNNVSATLNLLDAMVEHGVKPFIFSSTAAIFGDPCYIPIDEQHPATPISPYGRSKWMVEQILSDYEKAYGLRTICLRYFNAAGADSEGALGECHAPETHLIPLMLQVASGRRDMITVNGTDYDTPDGTCVRDYIHVYDLCKAHLLALHHLLAGGGCGRYNLGNGHGFSVREVAKAVEKITGHTINKEYGARRAGDPAILIADSTSARKDLGWNPQYPQLEVIVQHAWQWENLHFTDIIGNRDVLN
jgi:UDP-glucose 4-epimerase